MPTYRYECKVCGEFEVDHSVDTVLNRCVGCGELGIKKLIPTSFQFKCRRVQSEITPEHSHWFETEGKRRMALPDGHPDKLEPVSKSSDIRHGGTTPKVPKKGEGAKKGLEAWVKAGKPNLQQANKLISEGKI